LVICARKRTRERAIETKRERVKERATGGLAGRRRQGGRKRKRERTEKDKEDGRRTKKRFLMIK